MKQTKKMVVAAAAAVGAVAGGVVALANVPVGAAPEPTAQAVVASSMPSPSDPAEAAERARLEKEIAKAQRKLDRLASASPTAAAVVASGETVTVQGAGSNTGGGNAGGGNTGGDTASTPAPQPSSDTSRPVLRRMAWASLMAMRASQVRSFERPSNFLIAEKALIQVSWATSSASSWPTSGVAIAIRKA